MVSVKHPYTQCCDCASQHLHRGPRCQPCYRKLKTDIGLVSNGKAPLSKLPERERFYSMTSMEPSGCLVFHGARSTAGYGMFVDDDGRQWVATRWSYRDAVGPFDEAFALCHKCDYPPCVNPDHLFLGTKAENNADRDRKGRGAKGPRGDRCRKGHLYEAFAGLGTQEAAPRPRRRCAKCARDRRAAYRRQEMPAHLHGQLNPAKKYDCRCRLCRDVQNAYARDLNARRKALREATS